MASYLPHLNSRKISFLWKLLSIFSFTLTSSLVKGISLHFPTVFSAQDLVFFQIFVAFFLLWMLKRVLISTSFSFFDLLRLSCEPWALLRAFLTVLGMILWFETLIRFPFHLAFFFKLLGPFVSFIAGLVVLKERANLRRIASLLLGCAGASVLVFYDSYHNLSIEQVVLKDFGLLIALGSLLCFSGAHLCGKQLLKKYCSGKITLSFVMLALLFLGGYMGYKGSPFSAPLPPHYLWLLGLGLTSALGYFSLNQALQMGALVDLAPISFIRFFMAVLASLVFFAEEPSMGFYIGALFIFCASYYGLKK